MGVDGSRPRTGGHLALTAVTLGLIIWPLAFNLGAYGEVHYGDVFNIAVASTILFVVTLVNPVYPSPWIWVVRVALAAPMAWMLTAAWVEGSPSAALDRPAFAEWMVLIVFVSVPITVRLLVDMFMPELTRAAGRKVLWSVPAPVGIVGAIGFVVGAREPALHDLCRLCDRRIRRAGELRRQSAVTMHVERRCLTRVGGCTPAGPTGCLG